jgi:hypothetical protein
MRAARVRFFSRVTTALALDCACCSAMSTVLGGETPKQLLCDVYRARARVPSCYASASVRGPYGRGRVVWARGVVGEESRWCRTSAAGGERERRAVGR